MQHRDKGQDLKRRILVRSPDKTGRSTSVVGSLLVSVRRCPVLERYADRHAVYGILRWNAARAFASYLDRNPQLYRGLRVLELGAGGGLPGIVAAKNGARQVRSPLTTSRIHHAHRFRFAFKKVVLTDYPDSDLVRNLEHNVDHNIGVADRDRVSVLVSSATS